MTVNLTGKQEAFANEFVRTGNASEAYRNCYDVGENTENTTVWSNSCQLLANTHVSQRVLELQQLAQELTLVTVNSLTMELEAARKLAELKDLPAAMTGAIMGKAKLHGLGVEKTESKLDVKGDLGLKVSISFVKADIKED